MAGWLDGKAGYSKCVGGLMGLYLLLEGLFLVGLYIIISYLFHCSLRNSDTLVYFNIFTRWRASGECWGYGPCRGRGRVLDIKGVS